MGSISQIHGRLGKSICYYRNQCNMTQSELAYSAKLHRAYVGHVERGEKNITFSTLMKIAKALRVKVHDLVAGAEEPEPRIYFFSRKRRKKRQQPKIEIGPDMPSPYS